jgi:hypothetical protein
MMELAIANPAVRFRLITEAAEHVRLFDWADVAARTSELYGRLRPPRRGRRPALAPAPSPRG